MNRFTKTAAVPPRRRGTRPSQEGQVETYQTSTLYSGRPPEDGAKPSRPPILIAQRKLRSKANLSQNRGRVSRLGLCL